MRIEVLGTGCPKCKRTMENAKKAVAELGISAEISKVYDPMEIARRGVLETPALVIDGTVKVQGRVPTIEELKKLLAS